MITLQFATITRGEATTAAENYIKKKKKIKIANLSSARIYPQLQEEKSAERGVEKKNRLKTKAAKESESQHTRTGL